MWELGMAEYGDGKQYMELDKSKDYHPYNQNGLFDCPNLRS